MATLSRRTFTKSVLAAGLATSALSFPSSFAISRGIDGPLKIGLLLPTSGLQALIGQECKRAADVAPELIKHHLGMDIQILFADTESTVDRGRRAAELLIDKGAHLLVGCFDSGVTAVVAQVAEQRKIPLVINIAAADDITKQGYKYVFRNFPTGTMLVQDGMTLIKELFEHQKKMNPQFEEPKRAAFIYSKDTFGDSMKKGVDTALSKMKMPFEIVEYIPFDPKAKEFSSPISIAKSAKVDLLLPALTQQTAIKMIVECRKQGYLPKGIISPGSQGMYEPQFYKSLGALSNDCITNTAWFDPRTDISKSLIKAIDQKYAGEFVETNKAYTFDACLIAAHAAKSAKSLDPEALTEALRGLSIPADQHVTHGGPITFDKEGQNINLKSVSIQNKDLRPRIIFPAEIQETQPTFPMIPWDQRKS